MLPSCQSVRCPASEEEDDRPKCDCCGLPINAEDLALQSTESRHARCHREKLAFESTARDGYRHWRNS